MSPTRSGAIDRLRLALARRSGLSAPELAAQCEVSVPTLHRLLKAFGNSVITTGKARSTRYALRRPLRGDARGDARNELADLPVYEVDAKGKGRLASRLSLVYPQGSCMDLGSMLWPVAMDERNGLCDGLPYPLYDMRPQGYLGRQLARAQYARFNVSANPDEWSDEEIVHVLSICGSDVSGNLILGDASYEQWQSSKLAPSEPLSARALARAYPRLAEMAVGAGVAGSSAAGEFPKFPARRDLAGSDTPHVLVKFSGSEDSIAVRRWADLLVCEHLALECCATLPGVRSARTRIAVHEARTFLEGERFDRHGLFGRSPLIGLSMLNAGLIGDESTDWTRLAARLHAVGLLTAAEVEGVTLLWWFGRLVANSDMHTGNLSFVPHDSVLGVAPAYDMLPMLFAPLPGGEVPMRSFEPSLPLPPQANAWQVACAAAVGFWTRASGDSRISAGFQSICKANARRLQEVAERV